MRTVVSPWSARVCKLVRRRATLALLVVLAAMSCGGLPRTNYYTLRLSSPPPARDPKTGFVLGVEHFRAPEILRDDRIVFYESPTQLNFYQYHRWGSDPTSMLTELVARRLEQTGVFAVVHLLPSREPVDYFLRGRLLSFEEVDYETGVRGRVGLDLTLVRSRDQKMLWSETRQVESATQGKGVPGVVDALNAASQQLLDEALPGLIASIEHDFQQELRPSR